MGKAPPFKAARFSFLYLGVIMGASVITQLFGERCWCLGFRLWASRPSPHHPPYLKKGEGGIDIESRYLFFFFFFFCARSARACFSFFHFGIVMGVCVIIQLFERWGV